MDPVLTQEEFDNEFGAGKTRRGLVEKLAGVASVKDRVDRQACLRWTASWLPILQWVRSYDIRENLYSDVIAGFTVGVMNIPQGMAYGMLAGLDPVIGLYTSFLPPIIYAIFGTSKHVSFGTFAIISLMVASVVNRLAPAADLSELGNATAPREPSSLVWCDEANASVGPKNQTVALEIAVSLTLMVGIFQIILGVLNLGFLAVYLSDQLVEGLTTGAAIHVFSSQVSHILGISGLPRTGEPLGVIRFYVCLIASIGRTNIATVVTSIICIGCLIVTKEWIDPFLKARIKFPVPIELIVVVFSTVVSAHAGLESSFNMSTVGEIPQGIQVTTFPNLTWFPSMVVDALTLAVVIFSINVSIAKLLAKKHDYNIQPNQEWFAVGFAHLFSSFFSCHCSGPSLSRSLLQSNQGGKSQFVSVIASVMIMVVLLCLASLFQPLPKCALAAIIIVALKGMFLQFNKLPALFRKSTIDFLIWVVTFLSVVLLNVSYGLAIGVAFALLTVVFRSQWPDSVCLGQVADTNYYKSLKYYEKSREVPGVKIYRFDSPLYFANSERFREELYKTTGVDPIAKKKELIRRKKSQDKSKGRGICGKKEPRSVEGKEKLEDSMEEEVRPMDLVTVESPPPLSKEKKFTFSTEQLNVPSLSYIIIDCSSFPYLDVMGVGTLAQVFEEYESIGIHVLFASCKVAARNMFVRCGFYQRVPKTNLYVEVRDAVSAAKSNVSSPPPPINDTSL